MNKKGILSGAAALVVVAVAAWNLNISFKAYRGMSDIALANVEALANESLTGGYGNTLSSDKGREVICVEGKCRDCRKLQISCFSSGTIQCPAESYVVYDDCTQV